MGDFAAGCDPGSAGFSRLLVLRAAGAGMLVPVSVQIFDSNFEIRVRDEFYLYRRTAFRTLQPPSSISGQPTMCVTLENDPGFHALVSEIRKCSTMNGVQKAS